MKVFLQRMNREGWDLGDIITIGKLHIRYIAWTNSVTWNSAEQCDPTGSITKTRNGAFVDTRNFRPIKYIFAAISPCESMRDIYFRVFHNKKPVRLACHPETKIPHLLFLFFSPFTIHPSTVFVWGRPVFWSNGFSRMKSRHLSSRVNNPFL